MKVKSGAETNVPEYNNNVESIHSAQYKWLRTCVQAMLGNSHSNPQAPQLSSYPASARAMFSMQPNLATTNLVMNQDSHSPPKKDAYLGSSVRPLSRDTSVYLLLAPQSASTRLPKRSPPPSHQNGPPRAATPTLASQNHASPKPISHPHQSYFRICP
ncbi:hypothetical protein ACJBU6_10091 [Exserohilum turcicum]